MKILRFLRIFLLVNLMVYAGGAMAVIAKQGGLKSEVQHLVKQVR